MNLEISKRFVKDTQKITDKCILAKIQQVLLEAKQLDSLTSLANVEELAGFSGFYRIKFDYYYRIGIYFGQERFSFCVSAAEKVFIKNFHSRH